METLTFIPLGKKDFVSHLCIIGILCRINWKYWYLQWKGASLCDSHQEFGSNKMISPTTVFHFFIKCCRLPPLLIMLGKVFTMLAISFTKAMLIVGCDYHGKSSAVSQTFCKGKPSWLSKVHQCLKKRGAGCGYGSFVQISGGITGGCRHTCYQNTDDTVMFKKKSGE